MSGRLQSGGGGWHSFQISEYHSGPILFFYAVFLGSWLGVAIIQGDGSFITAVLAVIFGAFVALAFAKIMHWVVHANRPQFPLASDKRLTLCGLLGFATLTVTAYLALMAPLWAWDSLWYWAQLARELLQGGSLPSAGHPSYGAYSLAMAAHLQRYCSGLSAQLLWLMYWATCAFSVSVYEDSNSLDLRVLISLAFFASTPQISQALFSVGYFDMHLALCAYLCLVLINRFEGARAITTKALDSAIIIGLIAIGCLIKTTFLLLATILLFCWVTKISPRTASFLGLIAAPISVVFIFRFGLYFEISGREFSIDWERNPHLMIPGLWTNLDGDASYAEIGDSFMTALFRNASLSLLPLTAAIVLFSEFRARLSKIDLRILFSLVFLACDWLLQAVVPYFFESAQADTRYTRSLIYILLPLISYTIDKIIFLRVNAENDR